MDTAKPRKMSKDEKVKMVINKLVGEKACFYDGSTLYVKEEKGKNCLWTPLDKRSAKRWLASTYFKGEPASYALSSAAYNEILVSKDLFGTIEKKSTSLILTKNGIINLLDGHFVENDADEIFTRECDFEFCAHTNSYDVAPNWEKFLKTSLGIDVRTPGGIRETSNEKKLELVEQMLTYAVSGLFGAKKMILLLGPTNSGKSVLLEFIRRVVGQENTVPLSLDDLITRFRSSLLKGKCLVINDELTGGALKGLDTIKKVVSGEPMIVEAKGAAPENIKPMVKMIFGANQLPDLDEYDSGHAFADRLVILNFPNSVPRDDWDTELVDKLFKERDVIMSLAVKHSTKFAQNLSFTMDEEGTQILSDYKNRNATVESFINDNYAHAEDTPDKKARIPILELYSFYETYVSENALAAVNLSTFRQRLLANDFVLKKARTVDDRNVSCVVGIKPIET